MVALSKIYLNYWQRYDQPDINIFCTLEARFSLLLLILIDYGILLVFPYASLVLVVQHIHGLKQLCERL